ncbi:NEDD8-activating enzyme E1 regulatory subunit AXR1-like isoform X1 [Nicotiana tabacum]|uniref:NEDD8-activating enzyme E1 regulatory subunit AXR1-like isoform X1 n=2 Tax=Nicotiana tabacum TaxID=4097 RepID=A0AC58TLN2_TOBAC|nr:NEDD8-activating enzyme E1 regulatory subunit AXR1-like isoform X1 [Nicotiana tomentosiformis]XP_016452005.1 PREDICTED: NEDD8-activating enzyme E1 regulatory subunit-like isoform X1 [Nicotiana tabacum]
MAEPKVKYDRQLRIWGEQGQAALEKASICLLNCGPTGSETLKNLVLGGVGSITVVDGSKVEVGDLGNNFMVDEASVGQSKAKCVCAFLQELNDAVKAKFIEEHPEELIETNPSFFSQFTLVIATQLVEDSMVKLDRICREANIILLFARSYGLMGLVRISVKEHTVIESKPDHFLDDLRLNNPWPELRRFAETIDLNTTDAVVHKHTPYIIILVKLAEEWANAHGGNLPSTREEKRQFKDLIKSKMITADEENYKEAVEASYKLFSPQGTGPNLQKIIDDSCTEVDSSSSDFWVMVAALKEFIANEGGGETPLEGSIPDMTSSTELYINLQKTYQAKAEADFLVMEQKVRNLLKKIGRDPASISKANIKSFCKNARKLAVCRYRLIEDEFTSPVQPELQKYLTDEDYGTLQEANSLKVLPENTAVGLYILLRAADRFAANYNKFPGQFDGEMDEDISRLKITAVGLLNDLGCNGSALSEDLINEMCRYGASELHAVAAFVGGVASQEVIKLITRQFIPMSGTFIFNGIDHKSQLLLL